ncbi:MAG: hypothetical protein JWN82_384 [Candidatus Saccharibacteria bacterium]|nr:hypothetical protein [Candidatus Saccharibacteria bacterium]
MKTLKNSDGFSALHILLMLVTVGIVGFTGWYVWNANNKADESLKDTTSASSATKPAPAKKAVEPYANWQAYSSTVGNFTFKYPAEWTIKELSIEPSLAKYQKQELDITTNTTRPVAQGAFTFSLFVYDANPTMENSPQNLNGLTAENLTNGVMIAQSNKPESNSTANAQLSVVGKNGETHYYGYPLANKYYLGGSGGFAMGQKDTTSLTYEEQVGSDEWKDIKLLLQSIEFN